MNGNGLINPILVAVTFNQQFSILKNKRDMVDSLMRLTENARCYIVLLNLFFFCVKESAHSICFSSMLADH